MTVGGKRLEAAVKGLGQERTTRQESQDPVIVRGQPKALMMFV